MSCVCHVVYVKYIRTVWLLVILYFRLIFKKWCAALCVPVREFLMTFILADFTRVKHWLIVIHNAGQWKGSKTATGLILQNMNISMPFTLKSWLFHVTFSVGRLELGLPTQPIRNHPVLGQSLIKQMSSSLFHSFENPCWEIFIVMQRVKSVGWWLPVWNNFLLTNETPLCCCVSFATWMLISWPIESAVSLARIRLQRYFQH